MTRRWQKVLLIFVAGAWCQFAGAAGPSQVASLPPNIWPQGLTTPNEFDRASRAAILQYQQALVLLRQESDATLLKRLDIKSLNREYINLWSQQEFTRLEQNYKAASGACQTTDWTCGAVNSTPSQWQGTAAFNIQVPVNLKHWQAAFQQFATTYGAEQLRLAALFPKVTSEIGLFNSSEGDGNTLTDGQFYLTFDDGPTALGGNTDKLIAALNRQNLTAVFFQLGENLARRAQLDSKTHLSTVYANQCVASHGWQHLSHAKWEQWQNSITRTLDLQQILFDPGQLTRLFRPPYGQRLATSGSFFDGQKIGVALWNIDSQDWHSRATAEIILERVTALMLIKRKGFLLFHDVHAKAQQVVPQLAERLKGSVKFGECRQFRL